MAKKTLEKVYYNAVSPVGMIAFPQLHEPHPADAKYDAEKYVVEVLMDKQTAWKSAEAKDLRATVLQCGRDYFKDATLELKDFNNPFRDCDDRKQTWAHGHISLKCKSGAEYAPTVVGPDGKTQLTPEEIKKIKSGDFGRVVVNCYGYADHGQGAGVSCGLSVVQFSHTGAAKGGGVEAKIAMIGALKVELKDPEMNGNGEDSDEDEIEDDEEQILAKKPLPKGRPKKVSAPSDEDGDSIVI